MAAPTKKCEVCAEDVPNLKYRQHLAAHAAEKKENEKVEEVVKVEEPVKDASVKKIDPEMAALIKSALATEEKILEAPDAFFGEDSSDQHAALVKVHCSDTLDENSEYKAVFGSANKRLDGYTAKAYIPVLDEKGNLVRDEGGNPMFKVKRKIYDGRKDVYRKESSSRLRNITQEAKVKTSASEANGLSEEELTITRT